MSDSAQGADRAVEIADELLYRSGKALVEGDFDLFRSCFAVPSIVETQSGKRILKTEKELEETFASVRDHFSSNGVVDFARIVVSSEFLGPDTIGSTHASSPLLRCGSVFRRPYPVYSVIVRDNGAWRIASSLYAVGASPSLDRALLPNTIGEEREKM